MNSDSNENADFDFGEMTLSNENADYEFSEMTVSNYDHNESSDYEFGELADCHKSNGSSYIMDELDVPQPTYMATSDPNLSKLSSYLTSSS